MANQPQQAIPDKPQQEGSRWRYHRPTSDEVAAWFKTVPLDEGMEHTDFIAGVVLIPASEKVKHVTDRGTSEVWEQTYTPYVRVDTRVTYFRKLAEKLGLIAVVEPVQVPRSEQAAFDNRHMPDGFWWHVAGAKEQAQRFLCCTMRVALYEKEAWLASAPKTLVRDGSTTTTSAPVVPLREGVGTKQVTGTPDINGLAKAETGAIGRALGVAGILIVGTGIATAEDMTDLRDQPQQGQATLPEAVPEETAEQLNERLVALDARLRDHPEQRASFLAWWKERSEANGWTQLDDAPVEVRRGMATKMQVLLDEAPPQDSSPAEEPDEQRAEQPGTLESPS